MFHRRNRRDVVWTGYGYALATLGLQALLGCAPASSREFVQTEADAAPVGGRRPTPEGEGGSGGSGVNGATGGRGGSGGGAGSPGGEGGSGGGSGGIAGASAPDVRPPDAAEPDASAPDAPPTPTPPDAPPPAEPPPPDAAPPPDGPPLNLDQGLVSRWKLDEMTGNATADTTGTNPGTLSGPTRMPGGFPGAQYANPGSVRFDGDNDFVALGTRNLPANNRSQTVTFWFNVSATPGGSQICVALTDGQEGGSRLKLGFRGGRVAAWEGGEGDLAAGAAVEPGWHHYAYSFDGTTHRLYIDGALAGMSTNPADNGAVTNARLGAGYDNAENFSGQIDEVRVYNRALRPDEVTALRDGRE
jgi:hypothetical protein